MANIFNYVDKYGNYSFNEKNFNEIDNLVFSNLAYLDFTETNINDNNHTLEEIGLEYLDKFKLKEIKKYGYSEKDAYKLLKKVIEKKRYKNIIVMDYIYNIENMQFSAITFKLPNNIIYIAFEGTDQLIKGWRESFSLMVSFKIQSHYEAIKYLDKHIKLFGPKVIVGGHSKGGNLALVSSLNMNILKKLKIKKIYNNDGPGVNNKEYKSFKYKTIKKKIVQILPKNSIFGVLLNCDNKKIVKTGYIPFFSHTMSTWSIDEDSLNLTHLSKKNEKLGIKADLWLKKHNDEEKSLMINNIFNVLDKCEINDTMSLIKLKNIIKIIKELKNVDEDTKLLTIEFLKILI